MTWQIWSTFFLLFISSDLLLDKTYLSIVRHINSSNFCNQKHVSCSCFCFWMLFFSWGFFFLVTAEFFAFDYYFNLSMLSVSRLFHIYFFPQFIWNPWLPLAIVIPISFISSNDQWSSSVWICSFAKRTETRYVCHCFFERVFAICLSFFYYFLLKNISKLYISSYDLMKRINYF